MGFEEKSYAYMPIIQNDVNYSSPFNFDASFDSIFQNEQEIHLYEYYFHDCFIINESTGNSSNVEIISYKKENEQIDNLSFIKFFQDNKDMFFLDKKEKIFLCIKTKRPFRRFRPDDLRTKFVRLLLNCYLNKKILNYVGYVKRKGKKDVKPKLKKFPEKFIAFVALVRNEKYLDIKLMELISLYEEINKPKDIQKKPETHSKNKNFITLDEIKDKPGIKELLEKTIRELAYDYLKEFKNYNEILDGKERKEKSKMLDFGKYFAGKPIWFNILE